MFAEGNFAIARQTNSRIVFAWQSTCYRISFDVPVGHSRPFSRQTAHIQSASTTTLASIQIISSAELPFVVPTDSSISDPCSSAVGSSGASHSTALLTPNINHRIFIRFHVGYNKGTSNNVACIKPIDHPSQHRRCVRFALWDATDIRYTLAVPILLDLLLTSGDHWPHPWRDMV